MQPGFSARIMNRLHNPLLIGKGEFLIKRGSYQRGGGVPDSDNISSGFYLGDGESDRLPGADLQQLGGRFGFV
ncbi:hypothetical protein SDC9_200166 [bioreactor metagenome]|uniref:Uncharacterized protein n=1 Tax=bioreactor metagenome TaxID=1076179 RepID=A0A645IVS2_9ZZZZ